MDYANNLINRLSYKALYTLLEAAGPERATSFLHPYLRNAGYAAASNVQTVLSIRSRTPVEIGQAFQMIMSWAMEPPQDMEVYERGFVLRTKPICAYCSSTVCDILVEEVLHPMIEGLNPDYEIQTVGLWRSNKPYCIHTVRRKGATLGEFKGRPPPMTMPDEQIEDYQRQVLGEGWVNYTRAFVDYAGSEGAITALTPSMRSEGQYIGKELIEILGLKTGDPSELMRCLRYCNELMHMRREENEDSTEGDEIISCPFSSSPPELCAQHEAFCNGICDVVSPDYEFRYDRMMTKGDETCHWSIRKIGANLSKELKDKTSSETSLELLKKRFVRGEIKEEEYRRMKKVLEE